MISKCVVIRSQDQSEQVIIVKSGFKSGFEDLYLVYYESGAYEETSYEYHNKRYLLTLFPKYESEINQL